LINQISILDANRFGVSEVVRMASKALSGQRWDHDGRRAARLDVKMKAALRASGAAKFEIDVLDISVVGFRFDAVGKLNVGDRVWLTIPGMGGLESIVVWHESFHYGSEFVLPLHMAVFDHVLKQFGKPQKAD
jgi:hypothetical protein